MPRARSQQNLSSTTVEDDRITNTLLTLNVLYQTHIHPLLPEALQPVSSTISNILLSSAPYLTQVIAIFRNVISSASSISSGGDSSSALLSLGILLITLYMGLRIMNYIRRTIMGWVWLGVKVILLLAVVQVGMFVNSYGWERAIKQAGWLGGIGWGLLEDMLNQNQNQNRPPRGTRQRGQNAYNTYGDNEYGQRRGGAQYY